MRLGTTPQRVKLSDLDYPKDVESTAPLELLRQRFNREQGICVNDTFELQPQPASLSQTDSGTSDVRVSTRNLSVGNTVQSKKILRRSKSMPDVLNTTETTEEEKENLSQQKISKNTKKRNKNSDFKKANNVRRVLSSMNNTSNS